MSPRIIPTPAFVPEDGNITQGSIHKYSLKLFLKDVSLDHESKIRGASEKSLKPEGVPFLMRFQ